MMLGTETQTLVIDLSTYLLDEVILMTLCWLLSVPWAALFISKEIKEARVNALFIGFGVPLGVWVVYLVVGAVRALFGLIFLW